ncbi:ClpX C4-type zinc finger protein [Acetobacter senegalensis]
MSNKETLYCSFCGKSQYDVKKLITGPQVNICNECVSLSWEICADDSVKRVVGRCVRAVMYPVLRVRSFLRGAA